MMKTVRVKTYAGYRANQEPRAFTLDGKEFKVEEILGQYYEYDIHDDKLYRRYRVKTEDEDIYELIYDEEEERWYLKNPS